MAEPVLVVLAAGVGSRFGGLKQITPVDEQGHSIIDYSLYDAWRAGFRKVVFIIKHEIEQDFRDFIGSRIEPYFDVRYVFQELYKIPSPYQVPQGRTKPWGTSHALLCAKEAIDGPFAVINADDYYGISAFLSIYNFLKESHLATEHVMVAYRLKNTLTENGYVSRGVCEVCDGYLRDVVERLHIEKRGSDAAYTEDGTHYVPLSGDTLVSMNMWGFQEEILDEFIAGFPKFLEDALCSNPLKCEYLLPSVVNAQLQAGNASVGVLTTEDTWYGVTYSQDLPAVKKAFVSLREKGLYPDDLWLKPAAAYHFPLDGAPFKMELYGCGHINTTYLLSTTTAHRYILQRISDAFDVEALMHNIEVICRFASQNTDDPRSAMKLIYDDDGKSYYTDTTGNYRIYDFVEGSICLQKPESLSDFYESAIAFGSFQQLMSAFPGEVLLDSIPNFHNTPDRYRIFKEVLEKDAYNRAFEVRNEIAFVLEREEEAGTLQRMSDARELPLRVVHSDTKINNVLLDEQTRRALCVIDLDSVMLGLSVYDYGDSIRFGASTAAEDETDLDKVHIDLDMFRAYTEGFLRACPNLSEKEIEMCALGAKTMTLECGLRFLTDYLDGDHYFAVHRPKHNLIRCRTQFKLVADMEDKWGEMNRIVQEEAALVRA